jgi:hypothetical protein
MTSRRYTKYEDETPVFPGLDGFEFYENESDKGASGIVLVDNDGIVGELVNPSDKPGKYGREQLFRFGFGTVGTIFLLVWARGVESGLEIAAGWLETNAPGHLMVHGSEELKQLYDEAREELGEDADEEEVEQQATADLTYTESGYLTSYEWTVDDVTDKKLFGAAVYASDLADFRFHATAGPGVDIVEGDDVYFFMNPAGDGSSFWSVEGSKEGAEKTSVIVLASSESHAERTSYKYLDRVFGSDYVTLADEIDESEGLHWACAAISEWVRKGKKGPFKLLPKVGEQTENSSYGSDRWDPQIAKQVRQIVLVIGAEKAISAARQDGRERVDPHMAEKVRKLVKLTGVPKFERMVADASSRRRNSGSGDHVYSVRYVHKISPRATDTGKDVTLPGSVFSDRKKLNRALLDEGVLQKGARIRSYRVEGDEVIVFPMMPGMTTYWHAVVLKDQGPA